MNNFTNQQMTDVLTYIYIKHPEEGSIDHLCHLDKKEFLNKTGLSADEARGILSELQSKGLLLFESENSLKFYVVPFEKLYDFIRSGNF